MVVWAGTGRAKCRVKGVKPRCGPAGKKGPEFKVIGAGVVVVLTRRRS